MGAIVPPAICIQTLTFGEGFRRHLVSKVKREREPKKEDTRNGQESTLFLSPAACQCMVLMDTETFPNSRTAPPHIFMPHCLYTSRSPLKSKSRWHTLSACIVPISRTHKDHHGVLSSVICCTHRVAHDCRSCLLRVRRRDRQPGCLAVDRPWLSTRACVGISFLLSRAYPYEKP